MDGAQAGGAVWVNHESLQLCRDPGPHASPHLSHFNPLAVIFRSAPSYVGPATSSLDCTSRGEIC